MRTNPQGGTKQAATIRAVAERAGVSLMTVSNVVNGTKRVQDATRAAVMDAIAALDYRPNPTARALRIASARVGLAYLSAENAFLSSILLGAINAANRFGTQLLVQKCDTNLHDDIVGTLKVLIRNGANAIMIPAPLCETISRSAIAAEIAVPMIGLSPGAELESMPSVRLDSFAAAREMTTLLIADGHRQIGFIAGGDDHLASDARLRGYRAALSDAGVAEASGYLRVADYSFDSGLVAAAELLDLDRPPTAIFASNDDMAAAVVSCAHRRGLRVPEDLSIAGFDDTPIATKIWPALTTVRQPLSAMSDLVTAHLIDALRGGGRGEPPRSAAVPYEIVVRGSSEPSPIS